MSDARLSTIILVCAVIGVGTYLTGSAENIWRKVKLTGIGAVHMLLSKDKKFKPQVCPCAPASSRILVGLVQSTQTMEEPVPAIVSWSRTCFRQFDDLQEVAVAVTGALDRSMQMHVNRKLEVAVRLPSVRLNSPSFLRC